MPDAFRERVLQAVRSTGPGEVVSYGDVAAQAGYPGAARGVGAVLAASGPEDQLPWWRVVYSDGRLAPGHLREQGRRLRAEGVEVSAGRVVFNSCRETRVEPVGGDAGSAGTGGADLSRT